jgi:hypothetical protein
MNRFTDSHVVFFPRLKSWDVIFEKLNWLPSSMLLPTVITLSEATVMVEIKEAE